MLDSHINLISFSLVLFAGVLNIFISRNYAVILLITIALYITMGQVIVIGPFNFYMHRILIILGLFRVIIKREIFAIEFNGIDKLLLFFIGSMFVIYTIREFNVEAITNRSGYLVDTLGSYILFRSLIIDEEDVIRIIRTFIYIIAPIAIFMILEKITGRNVLSIFGGVPEFTSIREGKLRCQGPFMHPILAGTFGATTVPLYLGLRSINKKIHIEILLGVMSSLVIVISSASSGPVLSTISVIAGVLIYKFNKNIKNIQAAIIILLISMHLIMKAPVWYIFDRISQVMGGTGWHRSELINSFIKYFDEWWLLGTSYTRHWMPNALPNNANMTDITNQYIRIGIDGGLISLMLFFLLISKIFKENQQKINELTLDEPQKGFLYWCLGVALFAHLISFLSVTYFDQNILFFYLLIAMISCGSVKKTLSK